MSTAAIAATTATTVNLSPAGRFHLTLADSTETNAVGRYLRGRRLAADVLDAARRAEAARRLELALGRLSGPQFA